MNKPLLRNTLRKLRAVPFDRGDIANVMMVPQEMLDFLAMTAGIKPVFLLGRGFADSSWIDGVTAIARGMGHYVIAGPKWDAQQANPDVPVWFQEHMKVSDAGETVYYICRARGIAETVEKSFERQGIAMAEEARLLGYPLCCVQDHYHRDALFERTFYRMLQRTGGGDLSEMQRLLRENVGMRPNEAEEEAFKRVTALHPAPFTSIHMCDECAANPSGPASRISRQYEELARAVDQRLADEIAAAQQGIGRYQ